MKQPKKIYEIPQLTAEKKKMDQLLNNWNQAILKFVQSVLPKNP